MRVALDTVRNDYFLEAFTESDSKAGSQAA
jgi:hypothetical protein